MPHLTRPARKGWKDRIQKQPECRCRCRPGYIEKLEVTRVVYTVAATAHESAHAIVQYWLPNGELLLEKKSNAEV